MKPAWPAILRTTLTGTAQGLFLVVFLVDVMKGDSARSLVAVSCAVSLALLAIGLVASFFHPGRPERAWRSASQWRTSWSSREAIALPAFIGAVALYALAGSVAAGAVAAGLCLLLFICTGMIYAGEKSLPEWYSPLTLVNYFLLGSSSGAMLSVPLAVLFYPQFAGPLALAAFALAALAWLLRIASLVRNARLRPKSATVTALGDAHPLLVRAVRWSFLALLFPVPGWLLGWGGGSLAAFAAAFALQFAGLLAERWCFFAEARHPQGLNDQAVA